jgi:beta-xylosidase
MDRHLDRSKPLMPSRLSMLVAVGLVTSAHLAAQPARSGNPILAGWYADPEAHVFEGQYWIYPTYSAPYDQQTFMDAFSSRDLVTWQKHEHVLDVRDVAWARRALWAPSIVENDGWYYLFFGANDIQNDQQAGGIGVARSRRPEGPFKDYLGKPLIDRFHNGAQPIDQFVFKDADGSFYIVYGGWRHCNIAKLNADFTGFVPFADGTTFKEITPTGYVEGAFMLRKGDKYYFMWSEGGWTGPNYAVAYAIGASPFGPFERVGKILQQDSTVATGAGHHSVVQSPASGQWYIVYHRRPLGETDRNHRVVSIDRLEFDERGMIRPVKLTTTGVPADRLP